MLKLSACRRNFAAKILFATIAVPLMSSASWARLTISSDTTAHMKCSAGVCSPTSANAVLNVGDLETLLASGSIVVTTTGSGVQANDIQIAAALGWSSSSTLTLDAYRSISVGAPVSVAGAGGVSLLTNDGGSSGSLSFANGNISFSNLSSVLSINGVPYTLVDSVASLASGIAANPSGDFALARNYDAGSDGTYSASPIQTQFAGILEGLGNTISNLTIDDTAGSQYDGLFSSVTFGSVNDLGLENVSVTGAAGSAVGGIAGILSSGSIDGSHVSGSIAGGDGCFAGGIAGEATSANIATSHSSASVGGGKLGAAAGGLVGFTGSSMKIVNTYASGNVRGGAGDYVGGLVGINTHGNVDLSFATGKVTGGGGGSAVGGLIGESEQEISNSYATGAVTDTGGGNDSEVGGLVGLESGVIGVSYSSGKVTGASGDVLGGLLGNDNSGERNKGTYWDRSTSAVKKRSQGAGNVPHDLGIKGLTHTEFTGGLPKGFNRQVWKETTGINNGLPYLVSNPPP